MKILKLSLFGLCYHIIRQIYKHLKLDNYFTNTRFKFYNLFNAKSYSHFKLFVLVIIKNKGIELDVTIAFPPGDYFSDAKAEEIIELAEVYPEIDTFYMATAVGRFLSGYEAVAAEELKLAKDAAHNKKVFVYTEASTLNDGQMENLCNLAI